MKRLLISLCLAVGGLTVSACDEFTCPEGQTAVDNGYLQPTPMIVGNMTIYGMMWIPIYECVVNA